MTQLQALTKAIEKTIADGWQPIWPTTEKWRVGKEGKNYGVFVKYGNAKLYFDSRLFLYDHEFARHLFGEKKICINCGGIDSFHDLIEHDYVFQPLWKHRFQRMVISDDPLQYLADHLEDES